MNISCWDDLYFPTCNYGYSNSKNSDNEVPLHLKIRINIAGSSERTPLGEEDESTTGYGGQL